MSMALVRWEPLREISSIQNEVNRLFNTFFDAPVGASQGQARRWFPAMDLTEVDDRYVLRADLPGLGEDDVKIELEDNVLTISGERKSEHEERREGYHRVERATGSFVRSLTLPEGVDPQQIEASFDRGVLEVRIPKPAERQQRRVAIQVGGGRRTIEGRESAQTEAGRPKATQTDPTRPATGTPRAA
jgi:HSP20 family protein